MFSIYTLFTWTFFYIKHIISMRNRTIWTYKGNMSLFLLRPACFSVAYDIYLTEFCRIYCALHIKICTSLLHLSYCILLGWNYSRRKTWGKVWHSAFCCRFLWTRPQVREEWQDPATTTDWTMMEEMVILEMRYTHVGRL